MADESSDLQEEITTVVQQNLETVARFSKREENKTTTLQRTMENVSHVLGHPVFFVAFILFCATWIIFNFIFHRHFHYYLDEPPFVGLQGIIAFNGVLITMAVLIRQNRLAHTEEKRAQLELQVNLLAEQKVTKIIQLLEELRYDIPNVKNRDDPHAKSLQELTDPEAILNALEEDRK